MFALMIVALVVAVLMEKDIENATRSDLLVSENHVNNPTLNLNIPEE